MQYHMEQFTKMIIKKMRDEKFFPRKQVQLFCHRLTIGDNKKQFKKSMCNSFISLLTTLGLRFIIVDLLDWKWTHSCSTGIQRTRHAICAMGRKHGCRTRYWSSMDHVQASECSRTSGRFTQYSSLTISIFSFIVNGNW